VGDLVSVEVFTPPGQNFDRANLHATLQGAVPRDLGSAPFYGAAGGRFRAILQWVWDTNGLPSGSYTLVFNIPEQDITWERQVTLQPSAPEIQQGQWSTAEIGCCFVHTISGTAAQRDLDVLLPMIEAQAEDASRRIGANLKEKIHINLIPRILGQGGFTSDEVYVSYNDNNYANLEIVQLLHHEMVHRYDALRENKMRPTILIEGLAVYLSGGHYEPEVIPFRAAALLHSGQYIPLPYLSDHFYPSQHESGYILAGALVGYMVQRWGWQAYDGFYRDIDPNDRGQAAAIDASLRRHFRLSFEELESGFIGSLEKLPALADIEQDVNGTMALFDAIREYQKVMDTSAYFEQVWLPDAKQMRERGIVADYLRGPDDYANLQIEAQLMEAQRMLNEGDYDQVQLQVSLLERQLVLSSNN
jgi:hypothetical protein